MMRSSTSFLFVFLCLSFSAYANTWNNSGQELELSSLAKKEVPATFPEYSFKARETCKFGRTGKGTTEVDVFVSEDFLWASDHSYSGDWVKLYTGFRTASGKFVINVSEATKKGRNQIKWMQYVIPEGQSIVDALVSGKISGKKSGKECTFKANFAGTSNQISLSDSKPFSRQTNALNSLISRQELALKEMAKLGISKSEMFNFSAVADEVSEKAQKERKLAKVEEARKKAEAEKARKKAEAEEARKKAKAEKARKKAEAEEARKKAEAEEARKKAEEVRKKAEAEEARKKAEAGKP